MSSTWIIYTMLSTLHVINSQLSARPVDYSLSSTVGSWPDQSATPCGPCLRLSTLGLTSRLLLVFNCQLSARPIVSSHTDRLGICHQWGTSCRTFGTIGGEEVAPRSGLVYICVLPTPNRLHAHETSYDTSAAHSYQTPSGLAICTQRMAWPCSHVSDSGIGPWQSPQKQHFPNRGNNSRRDKHPVSRRIWSWPSLTFHLRPSI